MFNIYFGGDVIEQMSNVNTSILVNPINKNICFPCPEAQQ